MTINANTKIAAILKHHSKALDAIVSIHPKFEKLRNPWLRKLMAGRTTLAMAAKLGGCQVDDFYQKLEPLGFEIDNTTQAVEKERGQVPDFITTLTKEQITELDVRPLLALGSDPLALILERLKMIEPGNVLKIINTFEPTPLILLLEKKGFASYVKTVGSDQIETYFYKPSKTENVEIKKQTFPEKNWEEAIGKFGEHLQRLDVRALEMPQPMMAILEALDHLPDHTALYVFHKRIPVFLLPELAERKFDYRVKEISDDEVHLLIFK